MRAVLDWFERKKEKFPAKIIQLGRIQREIKLLFMIFILFIPLATFRTYFYEWAQAPDTYFAFSTDLLHLGEFLRDRPTDTIAYVVTNLNGVDVRRIPMPAQTVMFITDTFRPEQQAAKHIFYVAPDRLDDIRPEKGQKIIIAFLDGTDRATIHTLEKKFSVFKITAPQDFVILENYY